MEALGWRLRAAIDEDEAFLRTLFAQTNVTLQSLPLELQAASVSRALLSSKCSKVFRNELAT
jgi:hypothetical protein